MFCTPLSAMILPASDTSFPVITNRNFQQSDTSMKKESLQKERQILVDPISLRESSMSMVIPHVVLRPVVTSQTAAGMYPPPPLSPAKPKFIGAGRPNSATSSPRFSSTLLKKKCRNQDPDSPVYSVPNLRQESYLRGSKSCGEGRASAPSEEFDLCNIEADKDGKKGIINKVDRPDEEFKCGAMCLFLPGFGKGKPLRPRKEGAAEMQTVISRTVSVERFECGSWSSSAIINDSEEDGESVNLYFDLPMELIRNSVNGSHLPVTTGFVFDKNRKGVLKNGSARTTATKSSHESGRHVRFSTSSPTSNPASPTSCITPRLRKAREEFNAYLEAQSA